MCVSTMVPTVLCFMLYRTVGAFIFGLCEDERLESTELYLIGVYTTE